MQIIISKNAEIRKFILPKSAEIRKFILSKNAEIRKSFLPKMRKIAKCLMCKLEKERNVYVLSIWRDGYQLLPACCIFLEKSFFARKLCRRYFSLWQFVGISDIPLRLIVFQLVTVFSKCNCDRTADGITYLLLREVYICT